MKNQIALDDWREKLKAQKMDTSENASYRIHLTELKYKHLSDNLN